ncbi:MAG TPA: Gfo/Idh/MocA family oxidoreductase [Planctomycetota bacterium]|nr:Gfo/Idh/MocA family oxidoreductase [Planctomycetota bacterium]HRR78650.1 Gfo/Idh/MocA family oxidoreductase [Planctomycetota bacterium]
MPGKTIRVGIIGQGRSGYDIHARHLRTDRRYRIVAVVDPLADRRAQAEQEFGAAAYDDRRALLKRTDLDLVVNAAPSHLHVPYTLEALRAGHNVLCEKPLARRAAEVDKLIAAAAKAGKLLAIFQQSRFAPYFQQVRKVIASGVLGRIVMIKVAFNGFGRRWDWQTLQEYNGGNLLNTGPHPLDQALQLFGPGMPKVTCLMDRANTFGDAEDHVKLLMSGEGHPTIDLEISSCCPYPLYTYQVFGTRGGLTGGTSEMKWKYFDPRKAPKRELIREPLPGRQYCSEQLPWVEKTWTVPPKLANTFAYMSKQFYSHLYKTLTAGAPLVITPEQVRQQIAVIEECHRQNPLSRLDA